jgi:hypothetical protein
MYLSVMWNWGWFVGAICRPANGCRAPAAPDVVMSGLPTIGLRGALESAITPWRRTE